MHVWTGQRIFETTTTTQQNKTKQNGFCCHAIMHLMLCLASPAGQIAGLDMFYVGDYVVLGGDADYDLGKRVILAVYVMTWGFTTSTSLNVLNSIGLLLHSATRSGIDHT